MISQNSEKLKAFLSRFGFNPQKDFLDSPQLSKIGVDVAYESKIGTIYFKYLSELSIDKELPNLHRNIWNENQTEGFVVVSDNITLLCASKYKPDQKAPRLCQIDSFDYGLNTLGFEPEKLSPILKENIDFGFFWEYVRERIKDCKRKSVDYDLLLNLVHLERDLSSRLSSEKKYILIERCLFLKFLEDRGFLLPQTLINILASQDSQKLIKKFNEVNKSLNGDIFDDKTVFVQEDISKNAIAKLHDFFTTDYRDRQIELFPYKFDIIPIELLSNIYEAFLKAEKQASDGIYYTPPNLVDLVLSETLDPMLKMNLEPACLDFACGSGIFLVKTFQRLIDKNNCKGDFEKKKELLKDCIFGVEKDSVAARISIFSLYLTLLEGEDSNKIRQLIGNNKIKFPKLFGKNILWGDTLFDELDFVNEDGKKFKDFDVVVGNPPWSVNPWKGIPNDKVMRLSDERQAAVNDYQSSQYFTLKADDFMSNHAVAGIVFNNSNLLMGQAKRFRRQMLNDYIIKTVYELTQCNSILFNKQKIEDLEIGADEPAVAVIFKKKKKDLDNLVRYITPSLDPLSKFLKIIVVKNSEIKEVSRQLLFENDQLWRILSVGDMEDYRLIKKMDSQKDLTLLGLYGFSPTLPENENYKNILKDIEFADKDCISPLVFLKDQIKKSPKIGIKITRERSGCNIESKEYNEKKLLIKRYIEKNLRVKAVYDDIGYMFKDNLIGVLFDYDYRLMLSFFNSFLISYFLYFSSAQIGKGTWNMLHKNEIESVPIPSENSISIKHKKRLIALSEKIFETGYANQEVLTEIDEIIFNIYHLKEFEKQRVRDFFNIRNRTAKNVFVTNKDLQKYVDRFRNVFSFILQDDKYLNAHGYTSSAIGSGICFILTDKKEKQENVDITNVKDLKTLTAIVDRKSLEDVDKNKLLKQKKVKLYDKKEFAIIKSNQFKDWTETEAIKDANEEMGLFFKSLPKDKTFNE